MKNLIKKILREQTTGSGNYGDPIMDTSPGNVPPQSYDAGSYTHTKDGISHTSPVSKLAFLKYKYEPTIYRRLFPIIT